MQKYVTRRLLLAVPTLIGLTLMIFAIMRVLPGDPLVAYLDPNQMVAMSEEQLAAIRKDHGLDRPLVVQYADWMGDVLNGSFGNAMFGAKAPVINTIKNRGVTSAEIGIIAVAISWIIGLPVGIISAIRPGSFLDMFTSFTTVLFLAIPGFWLALLIVLATVTYWGYVPPRVGVPLWEDPWNHFQIVIFPATVMGVAMAAIIARMARSSLFEVLREDYVRTARSKGMRESITIIRHALPNALMPVLTLSGVMLGFALGGSVAVEVAFQTPGLGRSMSDAAILRDMTTVQSLVLVYGIVFVLANLLVDLLYGWIDPRIRLG
ncbi:MAG: ABC transporter permease [Dehalococcoidia bacterium]|nr:ABC transporter permease [Dehalococcoidia bacterium]